MGGNLIAMPECLLCKMPSFLAVILGSLLYRDPRAEETWNEVYARQNTGLVVSKSVAT